LQLSKGTRVKRIIADVKHGKNAAIRIELQDDDELWSEALTINAPGEFSLGAGIT
jgi:hypothetical protein